MKIVFQKRSVKGILFMVILPVGILPVNIPKAQSCPPPVTTTATSYSNTTGPVNYGARILPIKSLSVNAKRNGRQVLINNRIKAQDAGGQKYVSKVITITTVLNEDVLEISPVPATKYSTISWSSASNSQLNITLFDAAGHAVLIRQYPLRKGANELLLTNLETLPAGLYFVKAFDGANHRKGKLIVNHTL